MTGGEWSPSPLVVDGSRECVQLVAALPADWTTDGERLVLLVLACDAYQRESAPGLDNLAAWTGLNRRSVARILERLQRATEERPALLLKTRKSKGGPRATSRYRILPTVTEQGPTDTVNSDLNSDLTVTEQGPTDTVNSDLNSDLTVTEQGPTDTVNSDLTVTSTVTVGAPPSPSPENPSLSPEQRAVASALGLSDDDEKLTSVDQMLKTNGAQKPIGWIRGCAKNGDLARLLDDAHGATEAKQWKSAEADRRRCPHGVINGLAAGQCVTCTEGAMRAAS
jgi:hypothetical protein